MCSFAPYVVDRCKLLRHQNIKTLIHGENYERKNYLNKTAYAIRIRSRYSRALRKNKVLEIPWIQSKLGIWRSHWNYDGEFCVVEKLTTGSWPSLYIYQQRL